MIPVSEPVIGPRECEYVQECLTTGWISSAGRFIDAFEQKWSVYCGMQHGIAVSNGTVALNVAIESAGIGPGDEVLMPSFTIISCATAILAVGAVPVLVDSDPDTWTMDVEQLEPRVTSRTRAIMAVHIYGHPVDMDAVRRVAQKHSLVVIEDAAEAHGAEYLVRDGEPRWAKCGSLGDISTFSFYANKLVTTGEGGMVLTRDAKLAERARSLRNLCFRSDRRFYHTELGHNYRLTNVQAAIGLAQVERIDQIVASKRSMGALYTTLLKDVPFIQLPVERAWARQVYWMYGIVVDEQSGMDAKQLAALLRDRGIETRPFFLGMHEQPALLERGLFKNESYPVAKRLARQGLYLPSSVGMTKEQITTVIAAVTESVAAGGRS